LILQQDTHELQAQLSNERVLREDLESKRIKTEEFLRNVSVALCCEYVQVVPIIRTTRCFLSIDPQSPCPRLKCRPLRLLITLHLCYISHAHTYMQSQVLAINDSLVSRNADKAKGKKRGGKGTVRRRRQRKSSSGAGSSRRRSGNMLKAGSGTGGGNAPSVHAELQNANNGEPIVRRMNDCE
jgi:hypothetical protein